MTDAKIPDIDEYLVNGQLFVTSKQYRGLLASARAIEARVDKPIAPLIGDIPVHIVVPGKPVPTGDGSMVACFNGEIYVYPEDLELEDAQPERLSLADPPITFGIPKDVRK